MHILHELIHYTYIMNISKILFLLCSTVFLKTSDMAPSNELPNGARKLQARRPFVLMLIGFVWPCRGVI